MSVSKNLLLLAVTASAIWDFRNLKIPNELLIATILTGTAFCFFNDKSFVYSLISYAGRAALIVLILEPFSRMRLIGAGDAKLFSVMCAYLGIKQFARCFIWIIFFAGFISMIKLVKSGELIKKVFGAGRFAVTSVSLKKIFSYDYDRKSIIPLSVCTLAGYLIFLLTS